MTTISATMAEGNAEEGLRDRHHPADTIFVMRARGSLAVLLTLAVSACASAGAGTTEPSTTTTSIATTTTTKPSGPAIPPYRGFEATYDLDGTLVVILGEEQIPVYARPGDPEPERMMPTTTILGTTTVLATTGPPVDGWVEVMLPIRPNGSTGWVPVEEIAMYVVDGKIVVDLSDRELVYYVRGEEVLRTPVAIGNTRSPTPPGDYFVTDNVEIARSSGPWGPAALGLSARSDAITEFNGGDGIIGIHGTNRPGTIGSAASLGCVRVPNDVALRLHELVPIGTPVEIRA
ncbi:MAG TPA: L,D-transpeptidase [Acidimicrobiia bacterium]